MKITKDEVKYVADLARLTVSDEQADKLAGEMGEIITFAGMLSQMDTDGINPTNHAIKVENVLREDVHGQSYERDELIQNAPEDYAGCFVVPKIVE